MCQTAAREVKPRIENSANGIEVVKIGVNLQEGQAAQSKQFVEAFGFEIVADDTEKELQGRLFPDYATATFAIINGVTGSPSHQLWEIVYKREDLGRSEEAVVGLQDAIDSVKPAARTYEEWALFENLPVELSTPDFDADSDGLINAAEFAFGTNPLSERSAILPAIRVQNSESDSRQVVLSYPQGR